MILGAAVRRATCSKPLSPASPITTASAANGGVDDMPRMGSPHNRERNMSTDSLTKSTSVIYQQFSPNNSIMTNSNVPKGVRSPPLDFYRNKINCINDKSNSSESNITIESMESGRPGVQQNDSDAYDIDRFTNTGTRHSNHGNLEPEKIEAKNKNKDNNTINNIDTNNRNGRKSTNTSIKRGNKNGKSNKNNNNNKNSKNLHYPKYYVQGNIVEKCCDNLPILNPIGRVRISWDLFVTILLLYTCMEIPFTLAFEITLTLEDWAGKIAFVIDLFLLFDILVNFRTAYFDDYDHLYLITSPKHIAKR